MPRRAGEDGHATVEVIGGASPAIDVGFIGLGNVGSKLAGNLVASGIRTTVHDIDGDAVARLVAAGAQAARSPAEATAASDVVITCLPSPAISAHVLEGEDGVLSAIRPAQIWAEMSTTDAGEVIRLGRLLAERGAAAVDCPVSGGCHRAATGNISVFAGTDRSTFERILPLLSVLGRNILHTGPLGSASVLKVVTNYLATANLVALTEALTTVAAAGIDLATAYEAIRISSGNSFVHETESQVILNGSRNINFTMGLVAKDIGLFQAIADLHGVPLEISPLLIEIFADGGMRYGANEWSPNIIRRLEEATGTSVLAAGFPAELVDDETGMAGVEIFLRDQLGS